MNTNRTGNPRRRSTTALIDTYLRSVIDWASQVGTPTASRLAMSADALLAREVDDARASLAEAMGAPREAVGQVASDTVAEGVLRRSAETLATLGEDIDPRSVGVGLDAASRIIKERARAGQRGINLALIASASLAPEGEAQE